MRGINELILEFFKTLWVKFNTNLIYYKIYKP